MLGAGLKFGAGVPRRRDLGLKRRSQLGFVPRGVLADLRHLPVPGLAGPVQLHAGQLGSLPRPCRVLLGIAGARPGFTRPAVRAAHRIVSLLLRRGHPFLSSPLGLGNPCPRGNGLPLGDSLRRKRLRQPRSGLQCRSARLPGSSLGVLAALRASAAISPERNPRAAQILRPGHPATLPGQRLAPPEHRQRCMRLKDDAVGCNVRRMA